MKKTICNVFLAMFVGVYFVSMMVLAGWLDTHYNATMTVVSINNDTITLKDLNNDFWDFKGTDFKLNDKVKVTIYDNTTSHYKYDDEIVSAKRISAN